MLETVGIGVSPHGAFIVLHIALLGGTIALAYKFFRAPGALATALLAVASPMLWFLDKVHVELFTFAVSIVGVALVSAGWYLPASFALALAATQNPSFALVAFVPFVYRVVLERHQRYSFLELGLAIATALIVLVHPTYYFLRYGVISPQLLAGGAALGENLKYFYVWLLDPDLGLFPNWILGTLLVIFAGLLHVFRAQSGRLTRSWNWPLLTFLIIFALVNLYANSSTTNMNAGARGPARYALWYIPLFFPLTVYVIRHWPRNRIALTSALAIVLAAGIIDVSRYDPRQPSDWNIPSPVSWFIQTSTPWAYNPPPEVFIERYSGLGEWAYERNPSALFGPDCSKALLFPGESRHEVLASASCMFDPAKLSQLVNLRRTGIDRPTYVRWDDVSLKRARRSFGPGLYSVGAGHEGNFMLGHGWSIPEVWGVWSDGKRVELRLPCTADGGNADSPLDVSMSLRSFGRQEIEIRQAGEVIGQALVEGVGDIRFLAKSHPCIKRAVVIELLISNPRSPRELGHSADGRHLGIGLSAVHFGAPAE